MTKSFRTAAVFVNETRAGTLSETDSGYRFVYESGYNGPAVSLTLPRREEAYESHGLFPFFDGLIPEGWLLNVVTRNWKIDPNDRFGLLLAACRDCVGNVSIIPEEK